MECWDWSHWAVLSSKERGGEGVELWSELWSWAKSWWK